MVDRMDIDALLIGALYGELTPADEARLAAHLESHPADRTALEDLKSARQAVRESRILEAQLEPPQAISQMLLQEAARRAPRQVSDKESWFQRFVAGFMRHPAMAAAAMLVVVVSVAGTLYVKSGGDADKMVATRSAPEAVATTPMEPQQGAAPAAKDHAEQAPAAGSGYVVGLAGAEDVGKEPAKTEAPKAANKPAPAPARKAPAKQKYLEVDSTDRAPKEMAKGDAYDTEMSIAQPTGAGGGGAAEGPRNYQPAQNASRAAQQPKPTVAAPPPPAAAPAQIADDGVAEKKASDPMLAWARDQHQKALDAVRAGRCPDAAKIALAVHNRAPDYYAQTMASDRALAPCQAYINDARDKDAEQTGKARAQKRGDYESPAPASRK